MNTLDDAAIALIHALDRPVKCPPGIEPTQLYVRLTCSIELTFILCNRFARRTDVQEANECLLEALDSDHIYEFPADDGKGDNARFLKDV